MWFEFFVKWIAIRSFYSTNTEEHLVQPASHHRVTPCMYVDWVWMTLYMAGKHQQVGCMKEAGEPAGSPSIKKDLRQLERVMISINASPNWATSLA